MAGTGEMLREGWAPEKGNKDSRLEGASGQETQAGERWRGSRWFWFTSVMPGCWPHTSPVIAPVQAKLESVHLRLGHNQPQKKISKTREGRRSWGGCRAKE